MELYKLPRGSKFTLEAYPEDGEFELITLDGMYSYCVQGDKVHHFAAWTEVVKV